MKGYSIHIGVNKVDTKHYGKLTELNAACNDAQDMAKLAKDIYGYQVVDLLLNENATSNRLKRAFNKVIQKITKNDILLITYSGHGSQIGPLVPGLYQDEFTDQTWCLYDRQWIDDESVLIFSQLPKGTRVLLISDSCHSGTVAKSLTTSGFQNDGSQFIPELGQSLNDYLKNNNLRSKKLTKTNSSFVVKENLKFYTSLFKNLPQTIQAYEVEASILSLAACQDHQVAYDGMINGVFTSNLKHVLEGGLNKHFEKPKSILDEIMENNYYPSPYLMTYGTDSTFFSHGNPFLIKPQKKTSLAINGGSRFEIKPLKSSIALTETGQHDKIHVSNENGIVNLEILNQYINEDISNIEFINDHECLISLKNHTNSWDCIHAINQKSDELNSGLYAEIESIENYPTQDEFAIKAAGSETGYMPYWPPFGNTTRIDKLWHLDANHSELKKAREKITSLISAKKIKKTVRIGHLDTGWNPNHTLLQHNQFIRKDLAKSFVKGEESSNPFAIDFKMKGMENQGHGTGTLGIIAGGLLQQDGINYGKIGATTGVEIIPIRVAESVIILNTSSIVKGINYAVKQKCDVITMSLGGKPSKRLANAINNAYENGVTVVAAAGNSIVEGIAKIGPRKLVYPAKYDRVIAACGACHNQFPYDFDAQKKYSKIKSLTTRFMQGNWGPKKAMKTAIAAYTPNVVWLSENAQKYVQSGGGTSSATPQIASAAALWILKNKSELIKKKYSGTWKQVEAVKAALFGTADQPFKGSEKYYGNGVLKANQALETKVASTKNIKIAKSAKSSPAGILEAIELLIKRQRSATTYGAKELESISQELESVISQLNLENLNEVTSKANLSAKDLNLILKHKKAISKIPKSKALHKLMGM